MPRGTDAPFYYEQVIRRITGDIANGLLKPGDKLPSTATLAADWKFSRGTVRKAIDELIIRRVLRGHQGVGVFVAGSPPTQ